MEGGRDTYNGRIREREKRAGERERGRDTYNGRIRENRSWREGRREKYV